LVLTHTHTHTHTQTHTHRDRDRDTERDRERQGETEKANTLKIVPIRYDSLINRKPYTNIRNGLLLLVPQTNEVQTLQSFSIAIAYAP